MYSAVKVKGEPLYKAAREGRVVERQARTVIISRLDVLGIADGEVTFDVVCSKGTYVRTLCAEAGDRLGVGAYLQALERRRVGHFVIEDALTIAQIEAAYRMGEVEQHLVSIDEMLRDFPGVDVDAATANRVCHGVALSQDRIISWTGTIRRGELVRVRTDGATVALATASADQIDQWGNGRGHSFKIERVLVGTSHSVAETVRRVPGLDRGEPKR
jgi:tRNA pseudouridine55 synthase